MRMPTKSWSKAKITESSPTSEITTAASAAVVVSEVGWLGTARDGSVLRCARRHPVEGRYIDISTEIPAGRAQTRSRSGERPMGYRKWSSRRYRVAAWMSKFQAQHFDLLAAASTTSYAMASSVA